MHKPVKISLLPPNATPFELALEASTARFTSMPVPLRHLYSADDCPLALLPWLAWHVSIETWKPYWSEEAKRARVRDAITIHQHKGTAKAVQDVVAALGGDIVLREWWQKIPMDAPHTFELLMTLTGQDGRLATAEFVDDVIAEVNKTKPVRSHFTFTQGINAGTQIAVVNTARPVIYARVNLTEAL